MLDKAQGAPRATVKCFGVGDGWPSADRNHSSFLYRFEGAALLIDCGEPISRSLKASGLDYDLVDRLFLSHLHFDHVGGFFMLMQGFWLEGRKKELIVHAPGDGIPPLRQMLNAGFIFEELLSFGLRYEPHQTGVPVAVGPVTVTPFPTTHLARLQRSFQAKYPQSFSAFSFLIETPHLRVGHTADIGAVRDLAPLIERPLDVLVCELAHVPPEELFQYLRGHEIGQIHFIHLARECQEQQAGLASLASEILSPIPISFVQDGQEIVLGS